MVKDSSDSLVAVLDNFVCKYDEVEREMIDVEPFVIESHDSHRPTIASG